MALKIKGSSEEMLAPVFDFWGFTLPKDRLSATPTLHGVQLFVKTVEDSNYSVMVPIVYTNLKTVFGLKGSAISASCRTAYISAVTKAVLALASIPQGSMFLEDIDGDMQKSFNLEFAKAKNRDKIVESALFTKQKWAAAGLSHEKYLDFVKTLAGESAYNDFFDAIQGDLTNAGSTEFPQAEDDTDPPQEDDVAPKPVKSLSDKELKDTVLGKEPVKLPYAEDMYQPVKGTDSGSVYFLVARLKAGVNIAARLKSGGTLSVRAEGDGLKDMKAALVDAGLTYHTSKSYASAHFHCENDKNATRTLAAILAPLAGQLVTFMPDAKQIIGKGK